MCFFHKQCQLHWVSLSENTFYHPQDQFFKVFFCGNLKFLVTQYKIKLLKFSTVLQLTNRMQKMKETNSEHFWILWARKDCKPLKTQTQEIFFSISFYAVTFSYVKQKTILRYNQFGQIFCIEWLFLASKRGFKKKS